MLVAQVYRILNKITEQSYIGITKNNFRIRYNYNEGWWNKTHNQYLKHSVNKYGLINFEVQILEEGDGLDLENLERKYIKMYNSVYPTGFNFTEGGNYRYNHLPETIEKLSQIQKDRLKHTSVWNKGKKLSKDHIQKVKETKRIMYDSGELIPWNKGKRTGRPPDNVVNNSAIAHMKKVARYSLSDELVQEYNSIKSTELDGFNPCQVSLCCKGKAQTHKGFKFKYSNTD